MQWMVAQEWLAHGRMLDAAPWRRAAAACPLSLLLSRSLSLRQCCSHVCVLSRITTARPTCGGHATLQRNGARLVLPRCRSCGRPCNDRLVAECFPVCTGKSVSVFFATCRIAFSLSLSLLLSRARSLSLLYVTGACPSLPLCFGGMSTEWSVDEGCRADASRLMLIDEWQCRETLS